MDVYYIGCVAAVDVDAQRPRDRGTLSRGDAAAATLDRSHRWLYRQRRRQIPVDALHRYFWSYDLAYRRCRAGRHDPPLVQKEGRQVLCLLPDARLRILGVVASYAQKLVTVRLGGVLKLLDPVFELNPLNDFGQSVCAAELSPFLLS